MLRHLRGAPLKVSDDDPSSSSSDDDAFNAFSRKKKVKRSPTEKKLSSKRQKPSSSSKETSVDTSSNKRHHHQSSQRAASMDALLQELKETPLSEQNADRKNKLLDRAGSHCLPGEEEYTTNIFVGDNLSPTTTEEELTDLFRQFGDLYSVKIMWPRTPEEQARGRNSGFVCFMNRADAQDAMDMLQGSDPFNNGRQMFLNWGKNVKKVVKRGAGGVPIPPIRRTSPSHTSAFSGGNGDGVPSTESKNEASEEEEKFDPNIHSSTAIRVIPPSCKTRFQFISTVAAYVAKDGSSLENRIIEREKNNPLFSFMSKASNDESITDNDIEEMIFYRWRVLAFKMGDTFDKWRVEPFIMTKPNGRFWIPPDIDPKLSEQREIEEELKEEKMQLLKKQRRNMIAARKGVAPTTRRGFENKNTSSLNMLTPKQCAQWNALMKRLTCSRESICEAMAFCLDHSVTAQHISQLLKDTLLDNRSGVSIETKCARLFLMSDILFNSQQGVKNAFRYRDAIEEMAPEVFKSLGQHENGNAGRITMNKLRATTRKILNAWDSWSVYNPIFLDELESAFDGKPLPKSEVHKKIEPPENEVDPVTLIDEDLDGQSMGDSEISDSE